MLLGMNANTLTVGELNLFFRQMLRTDAPEYCSCGELLRECPIWSSVLERFRAALPEISLEHAGEITEKVEAFPERLIYAKCYGGDYVRIWRTLIDAIVEVSGATTLVNSSKTGRRSLYRALNLAEAGYEVSLLNMIRDPRAVTWSKLRREFAKGHLQSSGARFRAAARSGLHWSFTNGSTKMLYHGEKTVPYFALRYEDFMEDPADHLRRVEQAFEIDLSRSIEIVQNDGAIDSGHLVAGNEIRMQAPLQLRHQPPTWKTALPPAARRGVMVSLPIARHYHYRITDYR